MWTIASGSMPHSKQRRGGHVGREQHPFDVPPTPSRATRDWLDWLDRSVSNSRVRFGGERLGSEFSAREKEALAKGLDFIARNFESGSEDLQVSLAQVYAQGYLAGREDERTFGSPLSDINQGHHL